MSENQATDHRYYGRRKGKPLKAGRERLLDTLLPKLRIAPPTAPPPESLDPRSLFAHAPREVWLEIGFGSGEHLAGQAEAHPAVGFIGAEVFLNGVASLLRHVDERSLANVRIHDNDVRPLLTHFPASSLNRISLLFPDPWPKNRHAKRRFVGPRNLDEVARLLADGGEFRVATDHPVYARWTLQHVPQHPDFEWRVQGPDDWRVRPADSTPSRYEQKAVAAGRTPMFLRFFRRNRPR
ncbi:MAG: tRNA (guanosine(46)-N7)-methyltransferase TrmB [Rhodospirillaceae bacterium]|nr:tRNA (guanosine(46)-N7)-methyltransferase TrmB [Rhodospirillaceae bacterium]